MNTFIPTVRIRTYDCEYIRSIVYICTYICMIVCVSATQLCRSVALITVVATCTQRVCPSHHSVVLSSGFLSV